MKASDNVFSGKQFVVNITDVDNASPLLKACENGHDQCVELLLENGADQGSQVCEGYQLSEDSREKVKKYMDPLQYATRGNHIRYNCNVPKLLDRQDWANIAIPHQNAAEGGAVWSEFMLFPIVRIF